MQAETAKRELETLYHEMWRYMLAKDIGKLDTMHADDFVLVHMTGMRQSKAEYLRCIKDGELDYFTEKTEHIFIEVKGDKATLIGQSRVEAAVFGGSRNTWPLKLAFDVRKENGTWKLIGAKASTY